MLRQILDAVQATREGGELPIVLLDIDSTLIHTGARHLAILRAFAETRPHLQPVVEPLRPQDFGWGVQGPLCDAGIDDPGLFHELHQFWAPRFFDGAWTLQDEPTPGAVPFVQRLVQAGGLAYYLTARPAPTMGLQTVQRLGELGFPIFRGRAVLHLKPSFDIPDSVYKRTALQEIASLKGRVVATFENEPGHVLAYREAFPDARHVLIGSVHSPDAPTPPPDVVRLPDFRM